MKVINPFLLALFGLNAVNSAYGRAWLDSVAKYLGYAEENNIELTDASFLEFVRNKANRVIEGKENESIKTIALETTVTITQYVTSTAIIVNDNSATNVITELSSNPQDFTSETPNVATIPFSHTPISSIPFSTILVSSISPSSSIDSFSSKLTIEADLLIHNRIKSGDLVITNSTVGEIDTSVTPDKKKLLIDSKALVSKVLNSPNLFTSVKNYYIEEIKFTKKKPNFNQSVNDNKPNSPHSFPLLNITKSDKYKNGSNVLIPNYRPDYNPNIYSDDEYVHTIDYLNIGSLARIKYALSIIVTIINFFI